MWKINILICFTTLFSRSRVRKGFLRPETKEEQKMFLWNVSKKHFFCSFFWKELKKTSRRKKRFCKRMWNVHFYEFRDILIMSTYSTHQPQVPKTLQIQNQNQNQDRIWKAGFGDENPADSQNCQKKNENGNLTFLLIGFDHSQVIFAFCSFVRSVMDFGIWQSMGLQNPKFWTGNTTLQVDNRKNNKQYNSFFKHFVANC